SHEVALGYEEVTEPAITTAFQLKERPDRFLLAWTTTPWTTPANIALAVHRDIRYAVVEDNAHPGKQFIVAKELASKHFKEPVIIEEVLGSELEGKQYVPLFDYFVDKLEKPAWIITLADFVTTDEGTGIVHQAPAFGEEDYQNCKKNNLAFVQPVGEDGRFTGEVEDFAGLFVKEADQLIIERLEKDGLLFSKANYTHTYPFCWRCSTPLLYYALRSWFVAVSRHKERLIELNEKIDWYPEHVKHGRFGDWLANVKDWALSRNKFWGTPLPIWRCESEDCKAETAIGSVKELKEHAVTGLNDGELDLHKPFIDQVKLKCQSCKGQMARVPYVIDCWYDSGAATFAQFHYPFAKGSRELFEKRFPYDFITESIDQTRGWFYTLHALGALLFDSASYKSVVVGGLLVDEKGEKMSKSKGNTLNPFEVFDAVGVDAVRLQLCASAPDASKRFGVSLVGETSTPFLTVLWNSCYFAAEVLARKAVTRDAPLRVEDKWIISRANSVVAAVDKALSLHEYHVCVQALKSFVMDDFSRWYIRIVRERSASPDDALHYTFRYVISHAVRLLAPFAPYISEEIYRLLVLETKAEPASVHLAEWPKAEAVSALLESQMAIARGIVESVLSARDRMQRGLRWPVKRVLAVTKDENAKQAVRALAEIIKNQANIKELALADEFKEMKLKVRADYSKLAPAYGNLTPQIIASLAMHGTSAILSHVQEEGSFQLDVDGKAVVITREHLIVEPEVPANYVFAKSELADIFVETAVTEEMETEGYARELVRRVQQARKEAGLTKEQLITITMVLPAQLKHLKGLLAAHVEEIKSKVGALKLEFSDEKPQQGGFDSEAVARIRGENVEIFLTRTG
ncbi:MAG TPA: isoleucine--tRNA ligase, partial [Candidatus Nanoarchaeia archaeon]|nr:isoleucine--tRNA ligase [Candidatus Nanoarchaeia archaeon]